MLASLFNRILNKGADAGLVFFGEADDSCCLTVVGIIPWGVGVRSHNLMAICFKHVFALQKYYGNIPLAKK